MSGVSMVIDAGAGGRRLLATAASVPRQSVRPDEILLACGSDAVPLAAAAVVRLDARAVVREGNAAVAMNAAVAEARGALIAIIPAGVCLAPDWLERMTGELAAHRGADVLTSGVRLHSADGTGSLAWHPAAGGFARALARPDGAPRAMVITRSAWDRHGGYDETLQGLWVLDLWLRLLEIPDAVRVIPDLLASREVEELQRSESEDREDLHALRRILHKHRARVEAAMADVLVEQEVRFARLRDCHTAILERRDADLAELDRVRAQTAHHRAYLRHHRLDAFDWGDLRRAAPVSRDWGYDRGGPVDRRDILAFLAECSSDVAGAVLEVQEDDFTRQFGGPRVTSRAVLDVDGSNGRATVIADLRHAPELPDAAFDCLIVTQTLHVIDDMRAAVAECYRTLRPGGVLLATFPAASRVCLEYGEDGDLWRLTPAGARALVGEVFGAANVDSRVYGNVLTNTAFLQGLGAGELTDADYATTDPYFPALTGIRARKAAARYRRRANRGVVLLYHRVDDTEDAGHMSVSRARFEAHVSWIAANCAPVALERLLNEPVCDLPERAVAVTFDDGYVDNLGTAVPILQRAGVPAAFFLTTRPLEQQGEYWWDLLARVMLDGSPPAAFEFDGLCLDTSTAAARAAAHRTLHDVLVHARLDRRDSLTAALASWAGGSGRYRTMGADEIRALAACEGMSIGAHTVNHLALPDQDARVQREELESCRAALARLTGRSVDVMAYPYGSVDQATAALVRSSWRWGLTCEERAVSEPFDVARVPRLDAARLDVTDLAARIEACFGGAEPGYPAAVTLTP